MTHLLCPPCRQRFNAVAAAYLDTCPTCGGPLQAISADDALGFKLFTASSLDEALPLDIAIAISRPDPGKPS